MFWALGFRYIHGDKEELFQTYLCLLLIANVFRLCEWLPRAPSSGLSRRKGDILRAVFASCSFCLSVWKHFFLVHSLSLPLPCSFSFPFSACLSLRYLSVCLPLFFTPLSLSLFLPLSLANILSFDFAYVFQIIMQLSRRSANSSFQGAISLCQVCLVLFRIIIMQYLIKVSE